MKRIVGVVVVVAIASFLAWGRFHSPAEEPDSEATNDTKIEIPKPPKGPQPRAVLDEAQFDFGTMDQQQKGAHVFTVKNEGEGELELRIANTSCGCTSVKLAHLVWQPKQGAPPTEAIHVPPGQSVGVEMSWNTELRAGDFRTSAKVLSNDAALPVIETFIAGKIVPFVELTATQLQFAEARSAEPTTQSMHVYSKKLDNLELTGFDTSNELVTATFEPAATDYLGLMEGKSGVKVTVEVKPGLPIGPFGAKLTLKTNYAERPTIDLAVTGQVVGDVILTPEDRIDFQTVKVSQGATKHLFIKVRSPDPVEVKVVKAPVSFLKISLKPSESAKNFYRLTVEVPVGAPGGDFRGTIELETTHESAKLIKVPVRGSVSQ
jgi:hypothetical protein